MRVVRHQHPRELLAAAEGFLLQREAENTGVLGLLYETLEQPPERRSPYLCSVHESGRVVGVGALVSAERLAVSCEGEAAAKAIAREVRDSRGWVPSVVAPEAISRVFAHAWANEASCSLSPGLQTWLYVLRDRARAPLAQGRARLAQSADVDLVTEWVRGFAGDVRTTTTDLSHAGAVARRWIESQRLSLWEDGTPASMAGWGARTPHGARISMVYTPPSLRSRGYASMGVAHVTEQLFEAGCTFCCLFADRGNDASNTVYRRLGFERTVAFTQWRFSY